MPTAGASIAILRQELARQQAAGQAAGQPAVSVDTKKKELVGAFKNGGSDYRPKGDPRRVKVHDVEDKALGKVVPYGVYDVTADEVSPRVSLAAPAPDH